MLYPHAHSEVPAGPTVLRRRASLFHLSTLAIGFAQGCATISDDEFAARMAAADADDATNDPALCANGQPPAIWYNDADADGYGDPQAPVSACEQPGGTANNSEDCDDLDARVAVWSVWYLDIDNDGIGSDSATRDCHPPVGYVGLTGDCDDLDAEVFPGAVEVCDGYDNDCDGLVDDEDDDVDLSSGVPVYPDRDGDGWGDDAGAIVVCRASTDFVALGGDCDDADAATHPDAVEVCDDFIDNNCNDSADDCGLAAEIDLSDPDVLTVGLGQSTPGTRVTALGDFDLDTVLDFAFASPTEGQGVVRTLAAANFALGADAASATWSGSAAGGRLGAGVANIGDIDLDGIPDFLLGEPLNSNGGPGAGAVWVVSSASTGSQVVSTGGWRVRGHQTGLGAGEAVAAAGDVDQDGVVDILVGAAAFGTGGEGNGAAFLMHGPISSARSLVEAEWSVRGTGDDGVGRALLGDVDVNGDGVVDIIVAGPYTDDTAGENSGLVSVFIGPLSGVAQMEDADVRIQGNAAEERLGMALSSGADVDGDGLDDLIVGAPGTDPGGRVGAGAALVFGGDQLALRATWTSAGAKAVLVGDGAEDAMGTSVHMGGDFNADGNADIVVGATGVRDGAGAAFAFYGPISGSHAASAADHRVSGVNGSSAGTDVYGLDVNRDGYDDLLIGAPFYALGQVVWGGGI